MGVRWGRSLFLIGLLLAAGCGERSAPPVQWRFEAEAIYSEPPESTDPHLVFPRDLVLCGNRLYVLDGRLAHVAVCEPATGRIVGRFGSPGDGPGELGLFPHALVTDGERIGVVNLFRVSWFTPEGEFIARAGVPPHDLASPSIQPVDGGWLVNASWRGEGSPQALLVNAAGDSIGFGSAVSSRRPDEAGLAQNELNAVHVARSGAGFTLLARTQENSIQIVDPSGQVVTREAWDHFPRRLERHPDGRLRNMPGFSLSAGTAVDGSLWVLDGTGRRIRTYDSEGRLQGRHRLETPVLRLVWSRGALAYAIDGRDHILRLKLVGQWDESSESAVEPAAGSEPAGAGGTGAGSAAAEMPGELLLPAGVIEDLFRERGIWREGFIVDRNSPPKSLKVQAGATRLYVGYNDGQGLFLTPVVTADGQTHLEPGPVCRASPHGSYRSRLIMTGDEPTVWDARAGIFPLDPDHELRWGRERFPSHLFALGPDRWLLCDMRAEDAPLQIADGAAGTIIPDSSNPDEVQGEWNAPRRRWRYGWHFGDWGDGAVLIFDTDRSAIALWRSDGVSAWTPVRDPDGVADGWRVGEMQRGSLSDIAVLPGRGVIFSYQTRVQGEEVSWLAAAAEDGRLIGSWPMQGRRRFRGAARGPDGLIYLTTRTALYLWQGALELFE